MTPRRPRGARPDRPEPRPGARRRLRPATARDLDLLVVHRRRMWEEIGGFTVAELDRADGAYRRWVERERRAHRFLAYVVEEPPGRPVASGALWRSPTQPRPGALARESMPYLLSMYTDPAARGRGIASDLVRAMVDWARAHGYRRVYLHASKLGRGVYARLGFADGNEMRLDLPNASRRR